MLEQSSNTVLMFKQYLIEQSNKKQEMRENLFS